MLEDPRFLTSALRDKHINERLSLIQDYLRERKTEEWMSIFDLEGVPASPTLTRNQATEHPQLIASETLVETVHPHAGRLRQARTPGRFEGTPVTEYRGAPRLGEHNETVLKSLGYSSDAIDGLRRDKVIGVQIYRETETT